MNDALPRTNVKLRMVHGPPAKAAGPGSRAARRTAQLGSDVIYSIQSLFIAGYASYVHPYVCLCHYVMQLYSPCRLEMYIVACMHIRM